MERLDRSLANGDWRAMFSKATVLHLARIASDNAPIMIDTLGDCSNFPRPFRFEEFWAEDGRSEAEVASAWNVSTRGSPAYSLCQSLKATKGALR